MEPAPTQSAMRRASVSREAHETVARGLRGVARRLAILLVAFVLASPQAVAAQTPSSVDWPVYGNDLANTRFQNVDQITPGNVATLRPAWVFHTGVLDKHASLEVSPIVVGGTMFVTSGVDDVFALDAATGHERWHYDPRPDMPPLDTVSLCCGRANRGVGVADGKVFLARLDDAVVALDATTGELVWKKQVARIADDYSITMAPQVVNGLVIVGLSGGEFEVRGQVIALSAATGQLVWRFFTTLPGTTWAGHSWRTGAGTLWQTPAVDRGLGLLYVNTGNPGPDLNGIHRLGKNLYTDSIVALDISTGTVHWAFQEVHHDLWDYDSAMPALLFDLSRNGTTVPALGHCSKNGNYYILDRRTGVPIYPVTEVPVPSLKPAWQHPWPTQPKSAVEPLTPLTFESIPVGFKTAPQYTPPGTSPVLMVPGDDGGCEFPPSAYSPRTKFVYYGTRYEPTTFVSAPNNTSGIGSAFGDLPAAQNHGIFGATDTTTGRVVWKTTVPQPAKSGLVVAGDLVFFGESNGRFDGADARTGAMLWSFDGTSLPNGGGANAAPIAYVAGGREFVVNAFGGNAADRSFGSPVGDAIVAFALP
jgi:quinohemoprotein ethanol dehydrogenase